MDRYSIEAIITTHYDDIGKDVTKLRVVGIKKNVLEENIDYKNIENFIDYSLVEVDDGDVPEEALTIAKLLKIDDEIIQNAYEYL